jgi:hypothetical protein
VPSCTGATCIYTCNAGRADCNAGISPNTDGCECPTALCCGSSCQNAHEDGVGQKFYDCNPPGTYTSLSALAACQAYITSIHQDPTHCSPDWSCGSGPSFVVAACYDQAGSTAPGCWIYIGKPGSVVANNCPSGGSLGTWN